MTTKPDMAALQQALNDALNTKREADQRVSFARNIACDALNQLNAAQKNFDAGVAAIRAEARGTDSDWTRISRKADGVPCDL